MKNIIRALLVATLLSLPVISACGGGGNASPTPPAQPSAAAGIWSGTFTSTVLNTTFNAAGLVTDTNSARFGFPDTFEQFSGNLSVNGNSFSMAATAYAPHGSTFPDGSQVSTVTISGTFTQNGAMSGTYNGAGDSGTFALTFNSLYERQSSFGLLSGIWDGEILENSTALTISETAEITGANAQGCTCGGHLDLIDPSFNIYAVHLDIDTCGADNGVYDGLGYLSDTNESNDTLTVIMSSPSLPLIATLHKQT